MIKRRSTVARLLDRWACADRPRRRGDP